jgi:hypothetical protein
MLAQLWRSGLRDYRGYKEQAFGVFLIAEVCSKQFLSGSACF